MGSIRNSPTPRVFNISPWNLVVIRVIYIDIYDIYYKTHTPSTPRFVFFSLFEAPASKVLCWQPRQCDSWLRLCPFYPASTHIPRPCAKSHGARGRYRPDGHFHRGFVPFHRGFVFPRRYTEQPWPAHGPTQWLSPLTHPREGAPRALTTSCECRPPG